MNIKKFRKDIRARAFFAISKSQNHKVIIVEGRDDVAFYKNYFTRSDGYILENSKFTKQNNEGENKSSTLKLRDFTNRIKPDNNIVFLVDRDYDWNKEENNLFVTDYYSIENYAIISDTNNIYFKSLELLDQSEIDEMTLKVTEKTEIVAPTFNDILKYYKGKDLWSKLKWEKNKTPKSEIMSNVVNIDVVKRIKTHFKPISLSK